MSKPFVTECISLETKAWFGWKARNRANVCGRRGVWVVWVLISLCLLGAGTSWVASPTGCTYVQVWTLCTPKTESSFVVHTTDIVVLIGRLTDEGVARGTCGRFS